MASILVVPRICWTFLTLVPALVDIWLRSVWRGAELPSKSSDLMCVRSWPVLGSVLLPDSPHPPLSPGHGCLGCTPAWPPYPYTDCFWKALVAKLSCIRALAVQSAVPLRSHLHPFQAWAKALWEESRKTLLAFCGLWSSLGVGLDGWSVGLLDIGVSLRNICSTLYCIVFQKLLKKRIVAHEVWVVCAGNPVVNKNKRNEFTNGVSSDKCKANTHDSDFAGLKDYISATLKKHC